ncbi:hypothetical protein PG997_002715 [Apiospora hydei]|uniref:MYND-type domain-containing protein n=1 Tax=Apiospora hydei TaxID=1337664 RepID=A0ABR1WXB0_9PEZI
MDSVERLFRAFPNPESDEAATRELGGSDGRFRKFTVRLENFLQTTSNDPDHAFLKKHAQVAVFGDYCQDPQYFRSKILQLALSKTEIPNDGSAKSNQLRYHRWIGQGRKDSDRPFLPIPSASQGSSSLAHLPAHLMNTQTCATCGSGDAFACTGCLVTLDPGHAIFKTVYCSKECQAAHWPQHKTSCAARKMIGRAAFLLRDLFVLFQDVNYCSNMAQFREKDGVMYVFHKGHDEQAFRGTPLIRAFPRGLTPAEDDYYACVTVGRSGDSLNELKPVIEFFLKATFCPQIEEIQVDPRNVHRPMVEIIEQATQYSMLKTQFMLRVRLRSGEEVAIDLAGTQFGWQEPVGPWAAWETQRVYGQVQSSPIGFSSAQFQQKLEDPTRTAPWHKKVTRFRQGQTKRMLGAIVDTIKKQQPGTDLSIAKFLKLRDYKSPADEVLRAARQALEAGVAEIEASKVMRLYWSATQMGLQYQATDTKEQAKHVPEKV